MSGLNLEWFGCATFRLTVDGAVIFLDAYLDRVPTAKPTGLTSADVDRADWIIVGHSHFDHLYGAHTIALNTGATIVGSYETARVMREFGVPEAQLMRVSGGELVRITDQVAVRVLPALHSCVWTHREAPSITETCTGCLRVPHQEQLRELRNLLEWVRGLGPDVASHLVQTATGANGDGGTLSYVVESSQGSILFQDSAGCWSGILEALSPQPEVAILALGGRPNCDGEPWQGTMLEFLLMELQLIRPPTLILSHHDNFLPGFSQEIDVEQVELAMKQSHVPTELLLMDYGQIYEVL